MSKAVKEIIEAGTPRERYYLLAEEEVRRRFLFEPKLTSEEIDQLMDSFNTTKRQKSLFREYYRKEEIALRGLALLHYKKENVVAYAVLLRGLVYAMDAVESAELTANVILTHLPKEQREEIARKAIKGALYPFCHTSIDPEGYICIDPKTTQGNGLMPLWVRITKVNEALINAMEIYNGYRLGIYDLIKEIGFRPPIYEQLIRLFDREIETETELAETLRKYKNGLHVIGGGRIEKLIKPYYVIPKLAMAEANSESRTAIINYAKYGR